MTKRTVLSLLMLTVGGLASSTLQGLALGLPLLAVGLYWLVDAYSVLPREKQLEPSLRSAR